MRLDRDTRPTTTCSKQTPCACGKTITLGPDDLLQIRQRHLYGTTKWKADYGRRSNVESSNSVLKTHHAGLTRGSTRVFGCPKNAILLAFIVGATNLALLLSRYEIDLGADLPEGPVQPVPRKQTKKKSLHSRVLKRRPRPRPAPTASGPPPATQWATPS